MKIADTKIIFLVLIFTINNEVYTQYSLDSIYNILNGKWLWTECIPAPFECFEQPTENHSRSIIFSKISTNDSIFFETYKNDTLIIKAKTKIVDVSQSKCVITNDVIFGGEVIFGDVYSSHSMDIKNDTSLLFLIGNKKSTIGYIYKKESMNDISKIFYKGHPPLDEIYYKDGNIEIKINFTGENRNYILRLLTIRGISVYEKKINGEGEIVYKIPAPFPAGIYFCTLESNSQLIDTRKIVIGIE